MLEASLPSNSNDVMQTTLFSASAQWVRGWPPTCSVPTFPSSSTTARPNARHRSKRWERWERWEPNVPIRPAHTDLVLSMVTDDDASRSLWLDEENDALAPTIRAVQVVFARAVE